MWHHGYVPSLALGLLRLRIYHAPIFRPEKGCMGWHLLAALPMPLLLPGCRWITCWIGLMACLAVGTLLHRL